MTSFALGGWAVAAVTVVVAFAWHHRVQARLARIAEAEHELRGPLTALGFAVDGLGGSGEVGARALRAELGRARCALADLTAARTGRPPALPTPTVIDLGSVVRSSVDAWRPAAVAAGVELYAVPVATICAVADPGRLAQATGNLIANAIEHGGGRVQVRVTSTGGHACVEVADTGSGLDSPVRTHQHRGHTGTHGHGLRVATRVAAQHGGALTISHAHGGEPGALLALTLPLHTSS